MTGREWIIAWSLTEDQDDGTTELSDHWVVFEGMKAAKQFYDWLTMSSSPGDWRWVRDTALGAVVRESPSQIWSLIKMYGSGIPHHYPPTTLYTASMTAVVESTDYEPTSTSQFTRARAWVDWSAQTSAGVNFHEFLRHWKEEEPSSEEE